MGATNQTHGRLARCCRHVFAAKSDARGPRIRRTGATNQTHGGHESDAPMEDAKNPGSIRFGSVGELQLWSEPILATDPFFQIQIEFFEFLHFY